MIYFFYYGLADYIGSPTQDAWSYVISGNYLWHHFIGRTLGISAIDQYAVMQAGSRYATPAMLAFFSTAFGSGGATQEVANLFLAWVTFVLTATLAFFGLTQKLGKFIIPALIVVVFSGWLLNVIYIGNYDNFLALAFLPAFAGFTYAFSYKHVGWVFIAAALIAGLIYIYPELSPAIFFVAFLFLLQRIITQPSTSKEVTVFLVAVLALAFMLALPYIKQYALYIYSQFMASKGASGVGRPGGTYFLNLLHPRIFFGAYIGLYTSPISSPDPAIGGRTIAVIEILLSINLLILALWGCVHSFIKKSFALPVSFLILSFAAFYMLLHNQYAYGAYKFILLNWWSTVFLAFICLQHIWQKKYKLFTWVQFVLFGLYLIAVSLTIKSYNDHLQFRNMKPLKQLAAVKKIAGENPVSIDVRGAQYFAWALYYLRDLHLHILNYPSISKFGIDYMQANRPNKQSLTSYLLTDHKSNLHKLNLLWHQGPYYLWKLTPQSTLITKVRNKNGLEVWNKGLGLWLGSSEATFDIYSSSEQALNLTFHAGPGPSLQGTPLRHLSVATNGDAPQVLLLAKAGNYSMALHLHRGLNKIAFKAMDNPTRQILPNGDQRIMLIGISDLKLYSLQSN